MRYTNTHKITTIQARQIRLKKIHVMKTKKVKKKPSVGFEPANVGTKCQHATPRPPKPRSL